MTRHQTQRGMTVIELAVGGLLTAVFMVGAMGVVVRSNQLTRQNQAKLNATQAIRAGNDRILPLLRQAERVLMATAAIPTSVQTAAGDGFFPSRTTGSRAVILRTPIFNSDGSVSGQYAYTLLHVEDGDPSLRVTDVVMRPDGTLNYKHRAERLVTQLVRPTDRMGATLPYFTYFDGTGAQVTDFSSQTAIDSIVRVHLAIASSDAAVREHQVAQLSSEIRLANLSTRTNLTFSLYNPYGSAKTLNSVAIVGPTTATLTRVEFGTVAGWNGTTGLTTTAQTLVVASPCPVMAGTATVAGSLWFTPTSTCTGTYQVTVTTATGETLASSFTN